MQQAINNKKINLVRFLARKQDGAILIDVVITLLALGIMLAGGIAFYQHYNERTAILETEHRMGVVIKAFSNYAQMRARLPCPAAPTVVDGEVFGAERRNGADVGCADPAAPQTQHGIVPFRTLGIPEQYAKDGYGRFFTYIVSPAFVADNGFTSNPNDDQVHRRMASLGNDDYFSLLPKAKFCGGFDQITSGGSTYIYNDPDNQDVSVMQDTAQMFAGGFNDGQREVSSAAEFYDASQNPPDANFNRDVNVTGVSMALISHGSNGVGAYLANNTGDQDDAATGESGTSEENTFATNRLVQLEAQVNRSGDDANNYDDIVMFLTQDQVLAAGGGGSCEHL